MGRSCSVAAAAARKCCILYQALGAEAVASGDLLAWRLKPKFHMWAEMAEYQGFSLGNPSTDWAYKDEDVVGILAKLAFSRGGPKRAATTALKLLQHYRALCTGD